MVAMGWQNSFTEAAATPCHPLEPPLRLDKQKANYFFFPPNRMASVLGFTTRTPSSINQRMLNNPCRLNRRDGAFFMKHIKKKKL